MVSISADTARSDLMRRIRATDTSPELALRNALSKRGLEFEVCQTELIGKPDIVFPSQRVAIFIDGDLWHGGQWQRRGKLALEDQFENTLSKDYWLAKIRRTMDRDCRVTHTLTLAGWTVLRFWESDIDRNIDYCVEQALEVLNQRARPNSLSLLPRKTFAEFFAGIGLMRMGLEREGWLADFANDIDRPKSDMYNGHFEDDPPTFVVQDVHKLSAEQIPLVALATASFPCNDLSLAGARGGIKTGSSSSFWGFIKLLKEMQDNRPPLVLLENVPGFLTSHGGADFHEALISLNDLGYSVDTFMMNAASFVPQSRERLFVVGVLGTSPDSHQEFKLVEQLESETRPAALVHFIQSHNDIGWRIRALPSPPANKTKLKDILEDLKPDAPEWWSLERAEYLLNQMSSRHRAQADKMIAGSRWSYGTVFRRMRNGRSMAELRIDGIAGCLRTPRGGSGRQIVFKAGRGKYFARLLTPREAARLMGAEGFKITAPTNQALFGFGDAVCVPVIEWIARHYLNPLVNDLIHSQPLSLKVYDVEETRS